MPDDLLRMEYINSLPQPFLACFCGENWWWPVADIEVQCALIRIDVCGRLQIKNFAEVMEIKDADGNLHDPETFWIDYDPTAAAAQRQNAGGADDAG